MGSSSSLRFLSSSDVPSLARMCLALYLVVLYCRVPLALLLLYCTVLWSPRVSKEAELQKIAGAAGSRAGGESGGQRRQRSTRRK